ncbi:phage protein Gp36 family protein [Sorangium sp. So ce388]|uniref:phage protein Gp36 family protein n=1 Tax=Sorangium sp. So ce388 TaxID=3133309 RepID=UPI003F5C6193
MPATTPIIPLASAERTTSGTSAVIDLGAATTVDLVLDITAITGSLIVYVETARFESSGMWDRAEGAFTSTTKAGTRTQPFADLERYIRLRWELTGAATFGVAGEAVYVYCRPRDLKRIVSARALFDAKCDSTTNTVLDEYARDATDEVDGSLGAMYGLPLTGWGRDLRRKTAELATYFFLFNRGNSPDDESGKAYRKMHDDVQEWLDKVRDQEVELQGIVDSTVATEDGGAYIVTDSPRGWGR